MKPSGHDLRGRKGKDMTRAEILDKAKAVVTGQREQDYGSPESNFGLIGQL